ncbi:hypothetical protein GQR58_015658 [Nymphon striatum]|nr:hypothetical protein GQR58_015658 [Nymphon striatum]
MLARSSNVLAPCGFLIVCTKAKPSKIRWCSSVWFMLGLLAISSTIATTNVGLVPLRRHPLNCSIDKGTEANSCCKLSGGGQRSSVGKGVCPPTEELVDRAPAWTLSCVCCWARHLIPIVPVNSCGTMSPSCSDDKAISYLIYYNCTYKIYTIIFQGVATG